MRGTEIIKKVMESKFVKSITAFANDFGKKSIAANSASIAYYLFISIIPLFILLCSQLPLTGISKAEMTQAITGMMPETVKALLSSIISQAYNSRIGVFSFSIVILIWSSSRGMLALIRSLDIVYDEQDSRNIINMYVFAIFYTVCLIFGLSLFLVLYTNEIIAENMILSFMPSKAIYGKLAAHVKNIDVVIIGALIAAFIYKIAPAGKRRLLHQLPGALFASISISAFSVYFAAYSSGNNIYNSFYGSLTTVTIFLIWIYSCVNLFLIGGVINSHYRKQIEAFFSAIHSKLQTRKITKKELRRERRLAKSESKTVISEESDNYDREKTTAKTK